MMQIYGIIHNQNFRRSILEIFNLLGDPKSNWWFISIYSIHYLLNDFILLLINLLIDIFLVRHIKYDLNKKKEFLTKSMNQIEDAETKQSCMKNINKINAAEANTNRMIIFTLIVYSFCRMPELIVYGFLINPTYSDSDSFLLGPLLINIIQYLYVVSYSTNLFFYLKFNSQFKEGFLNLFYSKS